jgi:hypothetical protein
MPNRTFGGGGFLTQTSDAAATGFMECAKKPVEANKAGSACCYGAALEVTKRAVIGEGSPVAHDKAKI